MCKEKHIYENTNVYILRVCMKLMKKILFVLLAVIFVGLTVAISDEVFEKSDVGVDSQSEQSEASLGTEISSESETEAAEVQEVSVVDNSQVAIAVGSEGSGSGSGSGGSNSVNPTLALGICRGDMNDDGLVNYFDIDPTVSFHHTNNEQQFENADINMDNFVDDRDMNAFVQILQDGGRVCG